MFSLLESIIYSSPAGFLIVNPDGKVLFANQYANTCFGTDDSGLIERSISEFIPAKFKHDHLQHMKNYFVTPTPKKMEGGRLIPAITDTGNEIELEIGITLIEYKGEQAVLVSFVNVTDTKLVNELKNSNARLEQLAHYDDLTQLPNRQLFNKLTDKLLQSAIREQKFIAIAFIDINKFKLINDCYGHLVGDGVIKLVGQTIKTFHRETDICCRYGGDEFIVYFHNIASIEACKLLLQKLYDRIHQLHIPNTTHKISVSIGMSVEQAKKNTQLMAMIERADQAMYQAKSLTGQENKQLCY